jgi:signal transduction histidine kinase
VNQISDAARRSLNLLDRLVEVARLEGAAEGLSCAPCSLREIVENALQSLREQIRDQGIKLEIAVAEDDAVVDADELAIAVRNLVGNALKYGGSGGSIRVQAAVRGDQAVFEVADQGPGIAPDELPRVFDRYFRSTRSRQAGIEGSGLGLFIVKRIVELHGGHVEAESRVGAGSTFRIEIPATPTG